MTDVNEHDGRAWRLAREYGVRIEIADLGEWGPGELRSEYDPSGPAIRINRRVVERLAPGERGAFIAHALGHELHHHRERLGEVERRSDRAARERAADDFARALMERV